MTDMLAMAWVMLNGMIVGPINWALFPTNENGRIAMAFNGIVFPVLGIFLIATILGIAVRIFRVVRG
jgi:hypothetical protein